LSGKSGDGFGESDLVICWYCGPAVGCCIAAVPLDVRKVCDSL